MLQKHIGYLDSLKGFAIILVVLGHICAGYNAAQIYPSARYALTVIHNSIYMFHMPLFMTISGYVFHVAYITNDGEPKRDSISRQILNLLLMYLFFSLVLCFFKIVAADYTNSSISCKDILLIPILPISPYWYLYVLVTFYIVFSIKKARLCHVRPAVLLPILAVISVLGNLLGTDFWFSLDRSLYYLFFFALGIVLQREEIPLNVFTMSIFCIGVSVLILVFWHDRNINEIPLVNLMVGALFTLIFWGVFSKIRFFATNHVLRFVGCHSLEIYVLHCIFTAGNRAMLMWLGIRNAFISTFLNLFVSVAFPILLGFMCKSLGVHELFFKPVSYFCHKAKL